MACQSIIRLLNMLMHCSIIPYEVTVYLTYPRKFSTPRAGCSLRNLISCMYRNKVTGTDNTLGEMGNAGQFIQFDSLTSLMNLWKLPPKDASGSSLNGDQSI